MKLAGGAEVEENSISFYLNRTIHNKIVSRLSRSRDPEPEAPGQHSGEEELP